MGGLMSASLSHGTRFLSSHGGANVCDTTKRCVRAIFEALEHNPLLKPDHVENYLCHIPKGDNFLLISSDDGYNLLQKCVGNNNIEMVRWILTRGVDVNRCVCSLPLHISCVNGHEEITEMLLKAGSKIDVEARMCWPGRHNSICEQRRAHEECSNEKCSSDKIQPAICYAIDGDRVNILEILIQHCEDNWFPWQHKRPLLHLACERAAWHCVKYLLVERSMEINQCYDEYYPIHEAALHDTKFLELLLSSGADVLVRTNTQQMTMWHVVFLLGKKSAEETLYVARLLTENGLKELINDADSLGNTPLHALIIRYALEEARYGYDRDPAPWTKWDMLHTVRYLLQNGAAASINQNGNSALACVLRHVRDWEFRYELLDMMLQHGGDPNVVGRDGSVPLMVCLVPLINKDPLHYLTHTMKICYLNCVRLLCRHGAKPNCQSRSNLTPLHVLVFTASEYITLCNVDEKACALSFLQQLLVVLLQHGLDPNVRFSQRTQHVLLALMDMVQNARTPSDLDHVHSLTLTLLQYGADPNVTISTTEPMICHSQSSVYLKKPANQVLYYYIQLLIRRDELLLDCERYAQLVWLYYVSMNHRSLHNCLKVLHSQLRLVKAKRSLSHLVAQLYENPRTLKQMSRVAIYEALDRRTAQNVNKLPLPQMLKDYLLNWPI